MDNQSSSGLTFVLFRSVSGGLQTRNPALATALQQYGDLLKELLLIAAGRRFFQACSFCEADAPGRNAHQGWELGIGCFLDGHELAVYDFFQCFQAGGTSPATQWTPSDRRQLGSSVATLSQQLQLSARWGRLPEATRQLLLQHLTSEEGRAALNEYRLRAVQLLAAEEDIFKAMPPQLRGSIRSLMGFLDAEKEGAEPAQGDELQPLLEDIIQQLKAAAPKLLSQLPRSTATDLAAILNDLESAELRSLSPFEALRGALAFVTHHTMSWEGRPSPGPIHTLTSLLASLNPIKLAGQAARLLAALRIPSPNRVARNVQLRGEIFLLTLLEGANDVWELSSKLALQVGRHARRAVRPIVMGLIVNQVLHTLAAAQANSQRLASLTPAQHHEQYMAAMLGEDWREQVEQDLLDAIQEARAGLVTEDMVEEKRRISAAILRRLDREAYDRMLQYMAFDMANEINMHQGADSGESEEIGRWDEVQSRLYDWFYVMSRFGKNAHELANEIKTYPQDLDPTAIDFDTWVKDVIEGGYRVQLPRPDDIKDKHDAVDVLCASPSFQWLDPLKVKAALADKKAGGDGKIKGGLAKEVAGRKGGAEGVRSHPVEQQQAAADEEEDEEEEDEE